MSDALDDLHDFYAHYVPTSVETVCVLSVTAVAPCCPLVRSNRSRAARCVVLRD